MAGGRQRTEVVEDPSTGVTLTEVADADAADALAALAAADAAQAGWAATPARQRGEILRRGFEALMDDIDDLALLMTLEMGKPLVEAKAEIAYAAEFLRWFSEEAVRIPGDYRPAPAGGSRLITVRQPVGPAPLITPWRPGCLRSAEPRDDHPSGGHHRAAHRRPPPAEVVVHRIDGRRGPPDRAVGAAGAAGLDGARWQRPVRRLR
jgi:hypothetical protein